jgi:conjugative transfer pilus assembly protein TraH
MIVNHKTPLKRVAVAVMTGITALFPVISDASWMDDYFTASGAAMNVTPSAIYSVQNQTVMSLGGFNYRAPQRDLHLFSFSGPGYKAGCGGIDAWLGAYGFANVDQFVAALRNIGQNAVGYFFKLALATMAPEIDKTITDISDQINKLNQFNIGSCEQVKKFVGTVPDTRNMDFEQRAAVFGSAITGQYGDYFGSKNAQQTDPAKVANTINTACGSVPSLCRDDHGNLTLKQDINVAYEALQKSGTFTSEEIDLFISLFGTMVFRKPDSTTGTVKAEFFQPTLDWQSFVGHADAPATLKIRRCSTYPDCVYPPNVPSTTTASTHSFAQIVHDALSKIRDAIVNRTHLTNPAALQVIAMTSQPVYQMIAQALAYSNNSTVLVDQVISLYTEIVATEIAYRSMLDVYRDMSDAITKYQQIAIKSDKEELDAFKKTMDRVVQLGVTLYAEKQRDAAARTENMVAMMAFAKAMNTGLGDRLRSNLAFAATKK